MAKRAGITVCQEPAACCGALGYCQPLVLLQTSSDPSASSPSRKVVVDVFKEGVETAINTTY